MTFSSPGTDYSPMSKELEAARQHPVNTLYVQRKKLSEKGDIDLLRLYESGDKEAFDILFRRYKKPLYRFILKFLRDEEASRDAVQDVFIKVLKNPSRFEARSRFSTWLHAVARNLCLDMLRKRKIRNHPSLSHVPMGANGATGPALSECLAAPGLGTDEEAERGSMRLRLLVAISSIPKAQRRVFVLRELAGMSFREIAKELGIPLNTSKSTMRYALSNLKKALAKLDEERKAHT